MVAVEIGINDIFVLLRRVLGETYRSVWAETEPFGMLLEPRMIEGALHRKVQRDLHLMVVTGGDQAPEILYRSQLRLNRIVTAGLVADCIEAAWIGRCGVQ